MINKKGVIYYSIDDILSRLYQDEASDEVDSQKWFDISDIEEEFVWSFHSEGIYTHVLDADIEIMAAPQELIHEMFYLRRLRGMISDPVIIKDREKQEYLEGAISSLEENIDSKKYEYTHGDDGAGIESRLCYIWIYVNNRFLGVYNGFPQALLDGPLSPRMNYRCSVCDLITSTNQEIPKMFYDPETSDHVCPVCADDYGKRLRHVGS